MQKYKIVRKGVVIGIIFLLIVITTVPLSGLMEKQRIFQTIRLESSTLYVGGTGPENYTKIQYAIENSSNSDTVFVYNGTYYENVYIDKSIDLIGENKDTTIVDGSGTDKVIHAVASEVYISGFSLQNSGTSFYDSGIFVQNTNKGSSVVIVFNPFPIF